MKRYATPRKTSNRFSFYYSNLRLSIRLSLRVLVFLCLTYKSQLLDKFWWNLCFGPSTNTCENGLNRTTLSTSRHITPYDIQFSKFFDKKFWGVVFWYFKFLWKILTGWGILSNPFLYNRSYEKWTFVKGLISARIPWELTHNSNLI